jgi:hypothetical protein
MPGHGEKLTRRQELAIAALLSEPTVEAAAAKAKVSHATLKNWLRLPAFLAAYAKVRQQVLERSVARLLAASGKAIATLERNLECGNPSAENRAAELILTHAQRGVDTLDLARQIEDLRWEIEARKHGDRSTPEAGGPAAEGSPKAGDVAPTAGRGPGEPGGLQG